MEKDLNPSEVLRMLPHMTSHEKKDLYKKLKEELEDEMAQFVPEADEEKMVRQSQRRGGYHAPKPKVPLPVGTSAPSTARSSSSAAPPQAEDKKAVPECVRSDCRSSEGNSMRTLWTREEESRSQRRRHCLPWEDLKWGASGKAHWATCGKCRLKKVLYYSMQHGALVMAAEEEPVWLLEGAESSIILDTVAAALLWLDGCGTSNTSRSSRT